MFQFRKVQLRHLTSKFLREYEEVSIPQGTIKTFADTSLDSQNFVSIPQGTIKTDYSQGNDFDLNVSIPQGTIKTPSHLSKTPLKMR